MKWLSRLLKKKKCEHEWALVTSYIHKKDETEIIHYNWCLNCNETKILTKSTRERE